MITKTKNLGFHRICLVAVFCFGNASLEFPLYRGAVFPKLILLFSAAFALLYGFCFARLYNLKNELFSALQGDGKQNNGNEKNKLLLNMFLSAFLIYCVLCLSVCCFQYVRYIDSVRLPNTSAVILGAAFIVAAVVAGYSKKSVVYRLSIVAFFVLAVSIAVILLFSVNNLHPRYILSYPKSGGNYFKMLLFATENFGEGIILSFFFENDSAAAFKKHWLPGIAAAIIMFAVCFFVSIASLGAAVKDRVLYPFLEASSMVSFGTGFNRLEGLNYALYLFGALCKAAVILSVIANTAKHIIPQFEKPLKTLVPIAAALFCCFNFCDAVKEVLIWFTPAVCLLAAVCSAFLRRGNGRV